MRKTKIGGDNRRRLRALRLDRLRAALQKHGLPLHWEVLAEMVLLPEPDLFASQRGVLKFLQWHPGEFEAIGEGVFRLPNHRL